MEIKDVIHFYIGQDFLYTIEGHEPKRMKLTGDQLACFYQLADDPEVNYKLILRRLSDMTEEEAARCDELTGGIITTFQGRAEEIRYLLSEGFDLFNLIDAELAIDNKSL